MPTRDLSETRPSYYHYCTYSRECSPSVVQIYRPLCAHGSSSCYCCFTTLTIFTALRAPEKRRRRLLKICRGHRNAEAYLPFTIHFEPCTIFRRTFRWIFALILNTVSSTGVTRFSKILNVGDPSDCPIAVDLLFLFILNRASKSLFRANIFFYIYI